MEFCFDQQSVYIGVGILALLIVIWWFFLRKKSSGGAAPSGAAAAAASVDDKGKPTIYGSMGCPYTVKQLEKYPDHTFVDCTVPGNCPSFVTAYPTTKWENGKIDIGFS